MNRPLLFTSLGFGLIGGSALAAACATSQPGSNFGSNSGSSNQASNGSSSGGFKPPTSDGGFNPGAGSGCTNGSQCNDFPADPVYDMPDGGGATVSMGAAKSFGDPSSGAQSGGPCLYEPPPGALYPNNWLRPRFYWSGGSGQQVYELRLHASQETNDLVVYTTQTKWTMPKDMWTSLAADMQGNPITVSIRQLSASGTPQAGNGSSFTIAPAPAQGAMVFWSTNSFTTNANSTVLEGFTVGDESTATVLTPSQVQQQVWAQPPDGGNLPSMKVPQSVGCIGCHTSTPDGQYVGFTVQWPWPNAMALIAPDAGVVGSTPSWLGSGALGNLSPNTNDVNWAGGGNISATNNVDAVELGIETFTKTHFVAGDHTEVTSLGSAADNPENSQGMPEGIQAACVGGTSPCVISQLAWIDLEWKGDVDGSTPNAMPGATKNGGWGILARTGDETRSAGSPSWSHDGMTIAYTSSDKGTQDGHARTIPNTSPNADIKTIPYTANAGGPGGAGGTATAVMGASDPAYNEYYPSFSPDDQLIAFNRVGVTDDMYYDSKAEVYVVPASGGTPVRLAGNDPAQCVGVSSPGAQNSWPKWAPAPAGGMVTPSADGKIYYWVTFSSGRITDKNNPASKTQSDPSTMTSSITAQLYIAGVSVDTNNNNKIETYPAVYLWNQDPNANHLIPAWDNFAIPPVIQGPPR